LPNAHDLRMYAFAKSLDIDIADAKQLFQILSNNGWRSVDIDSFVVGCIRLKGAAKSMDLMDLMRSHKRSITTQQEHFRSCKGSLNRIKRFLLSNANVAARSFRGGNP